MSNENNNNAALGWFIAGLGLGALLGVLYAPKSGRETREDLISTAKDGTEYVRVRAREVVGQAGELIDRSKNQATTYVQRGKDVVEQSRAQWEEFVDKGKDFVTDQASRVAAAVEAGKQAYATATTSETGEGSGI